MSAIALRIKAALEARTDMAQTTRARARGGAKATIDHDEIRRWVEERGGKPAVVKRTANGRQPGILRIDFPGFSGEQSLEELGWDEWFERFDSANLAFLHQDETGSGRPSRFNKLVARESVEMGEGKPAARRSSGARSGAAGRRGTGTKKAASGRGRSSSRGQSKTKRGSSARAQSGGARGSSGAKRGGSRDTSGAKGAGTRGSSRAKRGGSRGTSGAKGSGSRRGSRSQTAAKRGSKGRSQERSK
jgi:hypothetical protein